MPDIHLLSATEIVYAVCHDGKLVHVGESDSIARDGKHVQDLKNELGGNVSAAYIEVTDAVRAVFEMPASVPHACLFRGNLERLLHAAFFTRYGTAPKATPGVKENCT